MIQNQTPHSTSPHLIRDESWSEEHRARAIKAVPNQGLHRGVGILAALHVRAIDYIEQAPILAILATGSGPNVTRLNRAYIAYRFGPLCERGLRLRDVLAEYQIPLPMRRLAGSALFPTAEPVLRQLCGLPSPMLGQIIPAKPGDQKRWLSSLVEWRRHAAVRCRSMTAHFEWAAAETAKDKVTWREIGHVFDFASDPHETFNERWTWERAAAEADLWHDRLAGDKALAKLGVSPDVQIDYSDLPDHCEVRGLDFEKLTTPRMLFHEGRRMRHCVATYVPDVMKGACNIYAVRRGERHIATLELRGGKVAQLKGRANSAAPKDVRLAAAAFVERLAA